MINPCAELAGLTPMKDPKSSFNIGIINGGTSINTIAQTSYLLLDLRSESDEGLINLIDQTKKTVDSFSMENITITSELIGDRPSGKAPDGSALINLCREVFMETGFTNVEFKSGSTDANLLFSKGICGVCIGICDGKDAHKPSEYLITDAMDKSIEKVGKIVLRAGQMEQG